MLKQSKMSGKLTGIPAFNTNTVSNAFCIRQKDTATICGKCYSHRMLNTFRKSCIPAFEHNSKLFSEFIEWDDLPRLNATYVRFNGHGELINSAHFDNIVRIAKKNPETTFTLWTKRASIVRAYGAVPDNLILIFSNPTIGKVIGVPRAFHKVFNNVEKDSGTAQNCTGKRCMDCLLCYRKDSGANVIVEAVK